MKNKIKITKKIVLLNTSVLCYNVITGAIYDPITIKKEIISKEIIDIAQKRHQNTVKAKQNVNREKSVQRKTSIISAVKKQKKSIEKIQTIRKKVNKRFCQKNLHGVFTTLKKKIMK